QTRSPGVLAGKNAVSRWRANRIKRLGIRKPHARIGDAVDVRRVYRRIGSVRTDVAQAHVVGQDIHYVWHRRLSHRDAIRQEQLSKKDCETRNQECNALPFGSRAITTGITHYFTRASNTF